MIAPAPDTTSTDRTPERQRAMALGWLKRGRVRQAIQGLQTAIDRESGG
jgi:hypothetical protein